MQGLLITGTDTGVGKTYLTARIARNLASMGVRVGVYKPACSGGQTTANDRIAWEDLEQLADALDGRFPVERICPYRLRAPLAPPVAALEEGLSLSLPNMLAGIEWWRDQVDVLLVEGVGGWLCPLTASHTVRDFAHELQFPVLVVARQQLGTINHTLLTVESIRQAGLTVMGVVLNQTSPHVDDSAAGNAGQIRNFGHVSEVWKLPCEPLQTDNTPLLQAHQRLQDSPTLVSITDFLKARLL